MSTVTSRTRRSKMGNTKGAKPRSRPRAAMALLKLSGDEQRILFIHLCNVLEPRLCTLSSASHELRALTQALLQELRVDHEAAARWDCGAARSYAR